MQTWLRRLRGALGIGLTWGAAWAIGGVMIGAASNILPWLPWESFFRVFDAPLPALALPGFVGGAVFSAVLGIAGRHRRFDELSVRRFAVWGALCGAALTLIPLTLLAGDAVGNAQSMANLWHAVAVIVGPFAVLGSASAAGSLMLARAAENRSTTRIGS